MIDCAIQMGVRKGTKSYKKETPNDKWDQWFGKGHTKDRWGFGWGQH